MERTIIRTEEVEALKAELKDAREQCNEVRKKLAILENTERIYNESYEAGCQWKAAVQAFIDAGFTAEQAFDLVMQLIKIQV